MGVIVSRLVTSDSDSVISNDDDIDSDIRVISSVRVPVTRDLLNTRIQCKVVNQAMEDHYMIAWVQVDINLSPMSTVITAEFDNVDLVAGDSLQLVCKSDGARPAASIR